MKIVIAPDSYKGSLTAAQVAEAMAAGVLRVLPDAELALVPMADGGEGTVQALVDATGGRLITTAVRGPLGEPVQATFGILGDGRTAVIEMAQASGLPLVPRERRNPLITTTYGTGELIRRALDEGAARLIIGIGGSATNDGGAGMAQALGVRLLDAAGQDLGPGGAELARLDRIDTSGLDPRLSAVEITVACDVDNPLTGPRGASAVFGPQKGATPEMVAQLDAALRRWAEVIRRDLGRDVENVPGAGAAGGLGAGLMALLNARLRRGVEIVVEATGLERHLTDADLCLTGEGNTDFQTAHGKTPMGVAQAARRHGVPVICISGGLGRDHRRIYDVGIDAALPIVPGPVDLDAAMASGAAYVADATERALRLVAVGMRLRRA
ncbi:MAG: glycerate kinase [Symbiobacterium sp.]|uniref:glycerate kinase n=1 Tax=Symbiobacterium sp. TaxID=1971213 RepID=UPI003463D115